MGRIAGYMQALGVIQSVVSYLDVVTDAMDIFSSGTIMGEEQKEANLIESQSKELQQAIEDMEPPDQSAGLWIMANVAIGDEDTDTLTAIAEQLFNMHVSFDAKVRDMNGAADDLEQHGQELYDASMKAKEAATHGTEDVLMAQAAAQYISLEKLAGTYRSAAANYRAAAAALQTISDSVDDFGDAVNDQSWGISQDRAMEQYQRERGAPVDR